MQLVILQQQLVRGIAGAVDAQQPSSQCNVRFDLALGLVHIIRQSSHFEDGFLFARRRHDVSARLLLNSLNSGSFRTDYKSYDAIRNSNLIGEYIN